MTRNKLVDKVIDVSLKSAMAGATFLLLSSSAALYATNRSLSYSFDELRYRLKGDVEMANKAHEKVVYWSKLGKTFSAPSRYFTGREYIEIK